MKKILAIVTILTVLIVGCGNKENIETEKNRRTETREKTPISKLYDWKQAKIKNIGDGSNFGTEFVVQNEKYIFFPQNGNKVVRLDKNNKNVKNDVSLIVFLQAAASAPVFYLDGALHRL